MVGHPGPGAFGGDPSAGDQDASLVSAVRSRPEEFLDSFRNLELERFMSVWGDNPSVFHPFAQATERLQGEEEIRAGWVTIFEGVRASQPGPPYLDLNARDVDVRPIGSDVAVATFHLDMPDALGRRSLVFELQRGDWRIVHLHASNLRRGT